MKFKTVTNSYKPPREVMSRSRWSVNFAFNVETLSGFDFARLVVSLGSFARLNSSILGGCGVSRDLDSVRISFQLLSRTAQRLPPGPAM